MTAGSEQVIRTPPTDVTTPTSALVKPTGAVLLAAFPSRPIASSWPATQVSRSAVLAKVLAAPFTLDNLASQQTRRLGALAVLSWLQTHPGDSWQQRWQASGAEERGRLAGSDHGRGCWSYPSGHRHAAAASEPWSAGADLR